MFKRFSKEEINDLRAKIFQGQLDVISLFDLERLMNERDAFEFMVKQQEAGQQRINEFLTVLEIQSQMEEQIKELKQRLEKYEPSLNQAV
ncbi:hypothetical protein OSIRIS_79 [Brevibacillus phage Osiris]|uniref:Uncharacterized protein n=3 Tax=Caudoviricetes TaxID=2731619 RepID=S5M6D0_9CAUD|nr:hypothetical protein DAVIES_71 [Brevibacillus phage Davies]YP_009215093.1 hypothetical protein AVV10_gp079 [Brevibacillus phage Osiris]AGR47596.1 hypothetical protein DAVIES_71 [Brevibacillus phage Davies]ALA07385.1 hypothetical protein OSIRIS_79 [Brevibacillus phage Osiris]ALA48089.1 hypothetical protein POWDER_79 [Brevibacillus phage Powder]